METVNGNLTPGEPNDLVDLVGELDHGKKPEPKVEKKPVKRAAAKKAK